MVEWLHIQLEVVDECSARVLGPVVFYIFINDIDRRMECFLSKSAVDTKLSCSIDKIEERVACHKDLNKLKKVGPLELKEVQLGQR